MSQCRPLLRPQVCGFCVFILTSTPRLDVNLLVATESDPSRTDVVHTPVTQQ